MLFLYKMQKHNNWLQTSTHNTILNTCKIVSYMVDFFIIYFNGGEDILGCIRARIVVLYEKILKLQQWMRFNTFWTLNMQLQCTVLSSCKLLVWAIISDIGIIVTKVIVSRVSQNFISCVHDIKVVSASEKQKSDIHTFYIPTWYTGCIQQMPQNSVEGFGNFWLGITH